MDEYQIRAMLEAQLQRLSEYAKALDGDRLVETSAVMAQISGILLYTQRAAGGASGTYGIHNCGASAPCPYNPLGGKGQTFLISSE